MLLETADAVVMKEEKKSDTQGRTVSLRGGGWEPWIGSCWVEEEGSSGGGG